jgi:hypothetical protein
VISHPVAPVLNAIYSRLKRSLRFASLGCEP